MRKSRSGEAKGTHLFGKVVMMEFESASLGDFHLRSISIRGNPRTKDCDCPHGWPSQARTQPGGGRTIMGKGNRAEQGRAGVAGQALRGESSNDGGEGSRRGGNHTKAWWP